ncbi:MAG: DsbA family protein [Acidobacteriota bacterium]|nr:DsbA family protein [Acidobacteriota bacterium]
MKSLIATALLLSASLVAPAQSNAPNAGFPFKNMSLLKPPAGAKVAIFEFEDMECPVCAADAPIVRKAVADYKVPYVRRDFPLTEIHIWSFDAAVTARYLQDKISPTLAEQFRRDVFANQNRIENKDDLARFTRTWFASHNQNLPFVMDASGACRAEVKSDRAFGDNLNIHATPCVFVVTQNKWVHVENMSQLYQTIDQAIAETRAPATTPRRRTPAHP